VSGDHPAARHIVRNTGVEIVCHALDLSQAPAILLGRVAEIGDEIADTVALTGRIG